MSSDVSAVRERPDGGWGWVVVIGAFVQHVITHGVFFSIGIIFTSLQEALNGSSKAQIAWIVSIEIGSGFLSGPVTGYLISRYGNRIVSVVGSILGALGYILSIYADNIYALYVTMGLISGTGLGMIIISAIVVVNEYFDKHRALAAGISMAGTGCGAFLFNPLLSWLVDKYGWGGCLLVLSAIILNCIPAGLVYRPLDRQRKHFRQTRVIIDTQSIYNSVTHSLNSKALSNSNGVISSNMSITDKFSPKFKSHNGVIELTYGAQDANSEIFDPLLVQIPNSKGEKDSTTDVTLKTGTGVIRPIKLIKDQYKPVFSSKNGVMELTYESSDTNSEQFDPFLVKKKSGDLGKVLTTVAMVNDNNSNIAECAIKHHRRTPGLLDQFALFKNVVFTLTVLAQFLFNFGFYVPFVYLPDKSKLDGIDEAISVWVLSTVGISSIVGRILFGYIADRPEVNRLLLYTSGFLISGVVTALLPFYNQTWMMFAYAIVFGMFTGMVLGLTPVVLIDLLGLEILPASFGISCLFRGFASLLGSPCAGFLVDLTGQFTAAFIVAGMFMVCGALVMTVAKFINRRTAKITSCSNVT